MMEILGWCINFSVLSANLSPGVWEIKLTEKEQVKWDIFDHGDRGQSYIS